jgi:hypothetical protein
LGQSMSIIELIALIEQEQGRSDLA